MRSRTFRDSPLQVMSDARLAAILARLPAFAHWRNKPLSMAHRRLLTQVNDQQLMSLVVMALKKLEEGVRG